MKPGEPVVLVGDGRKYFIKAGRYDFHTDIGVFKLEKLLEKEAGESITSHLDVEMKVRRPRATDFFHHLKRTGAAISPKDVGMIISHTGLNKNDTVLDAGTGSGILAIYLGLVAKRVVTYEIRKDVVDVARENIALTGLGNIEVRLGNVTQEIPSLKETFDLVALDMHPAAEAITAVKPVLNSGGFLVVFSPFMEQAKEVRMAIDDAGFEDTITQECIVREISISERGTRPSTVWVGHTGFVTFSRTP